MRKLLTRTAKLAARLVPLDLLRWIAPIYMRAPKDTWLRDVLMEWIIYRYYYLSAYEQEKFNRTWIWGGEVGEIYNRRKLTDSIPWWHKAIMDEITRRKPDVVIEVGCGSGLLGMEIRDEYRCRGGGRSYVGFDLNITVAESMGLTVIGGGFLEAFRMARRLVTQGLKVLVVCNGVLTYLHPELVQEVLATLPCWLLMLEPCDLGGADSRPWGGFAYTHPYRKIAQRYGLSVIVIREEKTHRGIDTLLWYIERAVL